MPCEKLKVRKTKKSEENKNHIINQWTNKQADKLMADHAIRYHWGHDAQLVNMI